MLYILPPPTAKPPSVWDLIINFHRKGCQEPSGTQNGSNSLKKSLKFDCREVKKSQRTWCKTSPSDQTHVSERDSNHDLKRFIGFTFSRTTTTYGRKKFSSLFRPKRDSTSRFFSTRQSQKRSLFREMKPVQVSFTHVREHFKNSLFISPFG